MPLPYDRAATGRPPEPNNRFILRYADEALTPLFPFGFGLSYARFGLSDLRVETQRVPLGGTASVSVRLTNAGERPGREVVQLYAHQRMASRARPLRRLVAFDKVALRPGESRIVTLKVPVDDLGFHDETGARIVEPGRYDLMAGTSSETNLAAELDVAAE